MNIRSSYARLLGKMRYDDEDLLNGGYYGESRNGEEGWSRHGDLRWGCPFDVEDLSIDFPICGSMDCRDDGNLAFRHPAESGHGVRVYHCVECTSGPRDRRS